MTNRIFWAKSHFSPGESVLSPESIVALAKQGGYTHIACQDTLDLSATPLLTKKAKEHGIEVIVSLSARVVDDLAWRKAERGEKKTKNPFVYLGVYAMNEAGFRDLLDLITQANSPENFYSQAQLSFEQVLEVYARGNTLISTGSLFSLFEHPSYQERLQALSRVSTERLLIETPLLQTPYYERIREITAGATNVVCSTPALFDKSPNERDLFEAILVNAQSGSAWIQRAPREYRAIDASEQENLARICGSGLDAATERLVSLAAYRWQPAKVSLPKMAEDSFRELVLLCKDGWKSRIQTEVLGYQPPADKLLGYQERLRYELGIINTMGFSDYFLLVHDVIRWCKANDIATGAGRGSVGGSLIAFLIGITDVDPIRFGLIFERFINPDRLDLPDIDLDFMSSRRDEVFAYLRDKYGADYVASISNYSSLQAAGILRAVAKAHGLSEEDYRCSKLMPKEHGNSYSLEEAMEAVPEIQSFAIKYPAIWQSACALQGIFRSYATHAAGVIVAGVPIRERAALFTRENPTVNWDKSLVEEFGLVKLDILGLTTLDLLNKAAEYVKERHSITIDYRKLRLDDKQTIDNFAKGKTIGVFQYDGAGVRHLLKNLAVSDSFGFNDLVAATALYRPGPMDSGLLDDYVRIKQGVSEPVYLHENMRPALEETGSVIIFQEQVAKIMRDLAGFSMTEADHVRKAMGKKDKALMAKQRDKFVDGAASHSGLDKDAASHLFDQIEKFAGYSFNKSHAAAYAIISYWSMWVKTHYPAEFYAAALSVLDEDKQATLAREMSKSSLRILPPDVNQSTDRFEIVDHPALGTVLYAPFQAVKGLSEKAAETIMETKRTIGRPFTSKADFVKSLINRRLCNIRAQDSLDKIGAFASIEPDQQQIDHPDRLRDQKILLPAIMVEGVKADRNIDLPTHVLDKIADLVDRCNKCEGCELAGQPHPQPRFGKKPKLMIVTEGATRDDCERGTIAEGKSGDFIKYALKRAGLKPSDAYITSFIKTVKGESGVSGETVIGCAPFLDEEIALLNPPVILILGTKAARYLVPELRGGWEEMFDKDFYDATRDCTMLIGLNPQMIWMDATKQDKLDQVVRHAAELVS